MSKMYDIDEKSINSRTKKGKPCYISRQKHDPSFSDATIIHAVSNYEGNLKPAQSAFLAAEPTLNESQVTHELNR